MAAETDWSDQGGLVPTGPSLIYNGTGAPELIAPKQTFEQVIASTAGMADSSGRNAPLIGSVSLAVADNDGVFRATNELEHRLQVADLGGRYST